MDESQSSIDRRRHAQESAEIAVRKVFAILGVDVDDPQQVESFREDLRFNRYMRRMADKGGAAFMIAMIVLIVGVTASTIWIGIVKRITTGA